MKEIISLGARIVNVTLYFSPSSMLKKKLFDLNCRFNNYQINIRINQIIFSYALNKLTFSSVIIIKNNNSDDNNKDNNIFKRPLFFLGKRDKN